MQKMPLPFRIIRMLVRSGTMVNHARVGRVLSLTAGPIGLLWCWFAITFPGNILVMCLVGVLSALLFYMAYCVVIYQVLRGRWRWFANSKNVLSKPPLAPD